MHKRQLLGRMDMAILIQGRDKLLLPSLYFACCGCCSGGGRVHGLGGEHDGRGVGEEHGVHWGTVELVEVETGHFCVGVYVDLPFLFPSYQQTDLPFWVRIAGRGRRAYGHSLGLVVT